MEKILFLHSGKSFLPEIEAYTKYFREHGLYECDNSAKIDSYDLDDYRIIWEFKGFKGVSVKPHQILVHEYASLSTGKFPRLKNFLKAKFNGPCDLRILTNEVVGDGLGFRDSIPFCYRDQGVDDIFINREKNNDPEFDFVYVGYVTPERRMDYFLNKFTEKENGRLLLIGDYDKDLYEKFKDNPAITFTGRIPYKEVPGMASKARYALNYIPDEFPFNVQTSTKVLEYLALGLNVITTDYRWINDFEKKYDCRFYKLNKNHDIDLDDIRDFDFKTVFRPEIFSWDKRIEASGVLDRLDRLVKDRERQV